MKVPMLGRAIDERFLNHRLRSTSIAGILCAVAALGLFMYRHYVDNVWSWDLLAVGLVFVVVKYAVLAWYFLTD